MTTYTWTVEVNSSALDDVQGITVQMGRRQITDVFRANTATITGRVLASLGSVDIGDEVTIFADDGVIAFPHPVFYGVVSDVQVTYGMVPNEDTWTIQAEDNLALLGRTVTSPLFALTAGDTTWEAALAVAVDAGWNASQEGTASSSTVSAQSLGTTNALNILNQIIATEQGLLYGDSGPGYVTFQSRNEFPTEPTVVFTDGTLSAGVGEATSPFDRVVFRSQADSYFTKVVVQPEGLAEQSSGTGDRTYTMQTYDETTAQAGNLADYVLSQLTVDNDVPQELSVFSSMTTYDIADLTTYNKKPYFQAVSIILRSVRYECQVQGYTITASPESARWTFYLSSTNTTVPFILDSDTSGVLDSSRLGF